MLTDFLIAVLLYSPLAPSNVSLPLAVLHFSAEYPWIDSRHKPLRTSAPQYADLSTTLIQSQLNDESVFPTKTNLDFPRDFQANIIKPIFRHLFRLLAHIYHAHWDDVCRLGCDAHLNTLFAHFWCFGMQFELLDRKEVDVLKGLVEGAGAGLAGILN